MRFPVCTFFFLLLLSHFSGISSQMAKQFQDGNWLFVNFESLNFNKEGLNAFFKGDAGQHHLMTIGLKNDSGKDIQALYCTLYILDLVGPHSEVSNPLFKCGINSPH